MDKCSSDAEFDSYWDYEAKNKNRNRIRVGRQYQATVPPLLKPGEKDGRKCEELETLKWKPGQLNEQEVEQYLSMAKGIGLFAKAVDSPKIPEKSDSSLQSAIKGLSEFVASHHPCHHDDGCQVPKPSSSGETDSKINATNDWSPSEAQLFAQALEACGKNFCAIKKDFLPWKPVRSIIEYYYHGKGEKTENLADDSDTKLPEKKEEDEPVASCSHTEKSSESEMLPSDEPQSEGLNVEEPTEPTKESVLFLENSRVIDHCQAVPELKMSVTEDGMPASSTVGSLKFFLGGRLVLKLNAQQDSGSGSKCQWVQSNDLPKHSNTTKKFKHKKKSTQDGSFPASDIFKQQKKSEELCISNRVSNYDTLVVKKPKLKLEHISHLDKQELLLCSSSWMPPVADGHESVEIDDGSSKTSEGNGNVSPVLSNPRSIKADVKTDFASNFVNELGEQNCDSDPCWVKLESQCGNVATESSFVDNSASKCVSYVGENSSPNQFIDDSSFKQEVLNMSALSHNKAHTKNQCYQPLTSHSSSPLLKQWSKSPNPVKTSPSSLSPVSLIDTKSPVKVHADYHSKTQRLHTDIPLDLSSKLENSINSTDHHDMMDIHKPTVKVECSNQSFPSETETSPVNCEFSPQSSKLGSHVQSNESWRKETKNNVYQNSEDVADPLQYVKEENNEYSPKKRCGDPSQLPYYCNLPYHCASPKCTKDYSLEEHLCNKSNVEKNQENDPSYILQNVDENVCKKSPWCSGTVASYLQLYPPCYRSYYYSYGMAPSPASEPTIAEVPLDLSSAGESIAEKIAMPENLPEDITDVSQTNTEAVERGMLYQLLKNKTSK